MAHIRFKNSTKRVIALNVPDAFFPFKDALEFRALEKNNLPIWLVLFPLGVVLSSLFISKPLIVFPARHSSGCRPSNSVKIELHQRKNLNLRHFLTKNRLILNKK